MALKNYYPELPIVPYRKTSVQMAEVVVWLREQNISLAQKVAAYVMFRNESGNGQKGVNENYTGVQADSSRWPEYLTKGCTGVVEKKENMTGKVRLFLAFRDPEANLSFLVDRIQTRQLYVGGTPPKIYKQKIKDRNDWALAYYREWVTGSPSVNIPDSDKKGLLSMYAQGLLILS